MSTLTAQNILTGVVELPELTRWADGWLAAKRAEGVTAGTLKGYHDHVEAFIASCGRRG